MIKVIAAVVVTLTLLVPGLSQRSINRREWLQPSWWTALREVRQIYGHRANSIAQTPQPRIEFVQGAFLVPIGDDRQTLALGWTNCETGQVLVAITPSDREDWNSMVHEQLHWIACFGGLSAEEALALHDAIEYEYRIGSR